MSVKRNLHLENIHNEDFYKLALVGSVIVLVSNHQLSCQKGGIV